MSLTTSFAIYFLIWWLVLFAVLPWGVRSQEEIGDVSHGSDPGAPAVPALGRKVLWTTGVSAVVFAVFYVVYVSKVVSLEGLLTLGGWLN